LSEQGDVLVPFLYSLLAEDNQERLTFNVIHRPLFYADVVDWLNGNVGCLHCWLFWKYNTEKTKNVARVRQQLVGQIHYTKVADKFLETCGGDQRFGNDTNK
jgi:hypothetical protein